MNDKPMFHCVNFHFEYILKPEDYELEGTKYTGIGVLAKMVDLHGNEVTEHIQDITTEPEVAQELVSMLDRFKVSPMCLKMFVEDYLAHN